MHIGVEYQIPEVATGRVIAHVVTVVVVVVGRLGQQGEHSEGTPFELVPRVALCDDHGLPGDPAEIGEAVGPATQDHETGH